MCRGEAGRKLIAVTNWTSFDEPDPADNPAWVRTVRMLLVFIYPAVAIGAAAFLIWATLAFNSYLINVPAWQAVFVALIVAAVMKSLVFVFTGNRLLSHNNRNARRVVLAVSWLGGPGISVMMALFSAEIGEGLGADVVIMAIPEAAVAAMISISLRSANRE